MRGSRRSTIGPVAMVERPIVSTVRYVTILFNLIVAIVDVVDRIALVDDVAVVIGDGAVVTVDIGDVVRCVAIDHGSPFFFASSCRFLAVMSMLSA